MLFLKYAVTGFQLALGLAPVGIALAAAQHRAWPLALAAFVAIFVVVGLLPMYRNRESRWVFLLTFLTAAPLNIAGAVALLRWPLFENIFLLTDIVWGALIFLLATCVEELLCALLARLLWPRQYKTVMARLEEDLMDESDIFGY